MSILIRDGFLVTMNGARETFERGHVAVGNDGSIVSAGSMEAAPSGPHDEVIDAAGMIVVPGLINSLQRPGQALLRGFRDHDAGANRNLNANDLRVSATVSALEMIRGGTTCCVAHVDITVPGADAAVVEPLRHSGLRQVLAKPVDITGNFDQARREAIFTELHIAIDRWKKADKDRVRLALSLNLHQKHENSAATERWIEATYRLACDHDMIVAVPLGGGGTGRVGPAGRTDVMYLMELGVLDQRWLLAHAMDVTETDIALMRESGCSVVTTPVSEAMQGIGIGRYSTMLRAGINCTLGSDGPLSGASSDMVEQMKACLILQNTNHLDPTALSPAACLEMATIRGARAIGWDRAIGSIEPGKRADIAIFDLRAPYIQVAHRPISNFVCSGSGRDAHTVLIEGKVLLRNHRFPDNGALKDVALEASEVRKRLARMTQWKPSPSAAAGAVQ